MDKKQSLICAVREGRLQLVKELVTSLDLSYAEEWSEGYDLLLAALKRNHRKVAKLLLLNGSKVNGICEFSITPLHYAATYGDIEIVEMLLDRNAQIDAKDRLGQNSLHHAVEKNQVKTVKLLLNRGVCVNANDRDGTTPLHVACKENHPEIVEILLDCGAYINPTIHITPVEKVCEGYTPLHYAVDIGSRQITNILLNNNASVNIVAYRGTPLLIAAQKGHQQIVLDLLSRGASLNSKCPSSGYMPLHLASVKGSPEIVRLLLSMGADVNAITNDNLRPLYIATQKEHKTIVTLLLEHGADIDAQNERGLTVLSCAVERGYSDIVEEILKFSPDISNESNRNCLRNAIKRNDTKYRKIVENLVEYGFGVNPKDVQILLPAAVKYGYLKVVGDLLRYGADVNMRFSSAERYTLLHAAVIYQQEEVAELLINCGANVNAKDGNTKTPIFYAIQNCHTKITKLLLANEANIENNTDLLNMAVSKGCVEIVGILLQCNLDIDVNGKGRFKRIFRTALPTADDVRAHIEEEIAKRVRMRASVVLRPGFRHVDTEVTPLYISVERGYETITKMLLNKGADVNAKREDGTTALHVGVRIGHEEIVEILLKHGAEIDSRTKSGMTPLHIAVESDNLNMVETLIRFGANINALDECGSTPLHIACQLGSKNMIVVLLQNGSDINIRSKSNLTVLDFTLPRRGLLLRQRRIGFYVSENAKVLLQHIAKLKADNLFISDKYLRTIRASDGLKYYFSSCEREIRNMKNGKIGNTSVSFYDILTKSIHQLAIYARNENILEVFESSGYVSQFSIYADILGNRFHKGKERQHLLKLGIKSVNALFGYELPHLFIDRTFSYLSDSDLKTLINACPCHINNEG